MGHRLSEAGIFDFSGNLRIYRESGDKIGKKEKAIRKRTDEDYTVGKGNFVKLEDLRHKRRRAFTRILEGLGIIAVAAGAAATIIIASDGCGEKSEPQEDVNSIALDL